ncbi:MAG: GYF domain-containing protein, partial [Elusimicrobiota bacterium]
MSKKWEIKIKGEVKGPYDTNEIVDLIKKGELPPEISIKNTKEMGWHPAGMVKELAGVYEKLESSGASESKSAGKTENPPEQSSGASEAEKASASTPPPAGQEKTEQEAPAGFSIKEAIAFGWNTTIKNLGFLIPVMLIYFAISLLFGFSAEAIENNVLYWVVVVLSNLVGMLLGLGFIKISLSYYDGQKPSFSHLYNQYPHFFKFLIAAILYSFMFVLGAFLLLIPGLILFTLFYFFNYFIVDRGVWSIDALKLSFKAT